MRKCVRIILFVAIVLMASACSTTKFVPEDKYLLNKARVQVTDRKAVNERHRKHEEALDGDALADKMRGYLRQKNNSEILGFWKLQLQIYSTASRDTSKQQAKNAMKMGEAPEIFNPELADISVRQIKQGMRNSGYYDATVDTTMKVRKRKLALTYHVTANEPYMISEYNVHLQQSDLHRLATEHGVTIHPDMIFDSELLNAERERITAGMRRRGYYYFEKDLLHFRADSAFGNHTVRVGLELPSYVRTAPDSIQQRIFTRYKIRRIHYLTDFDMTQRPDTSVVYVKVIDGCSFAHVGNRLLREKVLMRNTAFAPGDYYNAARVERTYSALTALGPVKYVDISFEQVGDDELDCFIVLSRSKLNSVSAELEGTYSAGDWGIAAGVGYANKNLFRGAEELRLSGYGSYEWRQNGGRAIEAKAEASIQFTNAPKVSVGYRYQNRPDEFTRTVANASLSYTLSPYGRRMTHIFNFLDISYVYLPWISDAFRDRFLQPTNLLKSSYEDHFIMDWSYAGTYSSYSQRNPYRSYGTFGYQIETAGNVLYGLSHLAHLPKDEDGAYRIFNIRYAQYVKADFNFAYHEIFARNHRLVYHAALGVAIPFGNANAIPFEKRYFAGGANSVRGWQVRSLGPGSYRGVSDRIDYNSQVGDIKLDLNLEYRWHVISVLELAAFTDAGNVWTFNDYPSQPYGQFKFNEFYKQIAWSYGVGVRLDLSFFVFRVDMGVKLYDPSYLYSETPEKVWRTASNGLGWKNDFTFHFAIGYPF